MTRDDIIRMAREADPGFEADPHLGESLVGMEAIERFSALVAALVAAAERERLAKALDHQCRGMSDYFEVKWIRELATALRRNQ